MKYINIILLSLVLLVSGCATVNKESSTPTTENRIAVTSSIIQTSAQLGVYYAIYKDTNSKPYFEVVVVILDKVLGTKDYSPKKVYEEISQISVKEVKSEEAILAINSALIIYDNYFKEKVSANLDKEIYIKPVLLALKNGIEGGLVSSKTEKEFNLKKPVK